MAGHWDADGTHMAAAIQRSALRHGAGAPAARFPVVVDAAGVALRITLRELLEMRYLWRQPVRMANARLIAVLGRSRIRPWNEPSKPR